MRPPSGGKELVLSSGLKEIVPPTCSPKAPARVALSLKVAPTMPEDGFWVVSIEGEAWPIATGSSAQPETASLLLAWSEEQATELQVRGAVGLGPRGGSY